MYRSHMVLAVLKVASVNNFGTEGGGGAGGLVFLWF